MDTNSDEIQKIEKEIEDDFEKTDREIEQLQNNEPKGFAKWEWLIGGITLIIIGIAMIYAYYKITDLLELLGFGIFILISGICSIIYREFVVLLL